jgi:predicted nucleotidyltransferase
MIDLEKLKDTLLDKIRKDYANDISLVHVHGSYISGNRHNLSDLDIFFVPKTERGFKLGFTFILDNIGIDFWALSWERLERIANHEEVVISLLTEGNILYYCSEEDLNRFYGLREKALHL